MGKCQKTSGFFLTHTVYRLNAPYTRHPLAVVVVRVVYCILKRPSATSATSLTHLIWTLSHRTRRPYRETTRLPCRRLALTTTNLHLNRPQSSVPVMHRGGTTYDARTYLLTGNWPQYVGFLLNVTSCARMDARMHT